MMLNSRLSRKKRARGLTLIEILVSLFVSSVVLAGVLQIYSSSKQSYRVQEALSRLQENGRFAMELITKDLRKSGYLGCMSTRGLTNQTSQDTRLQNVLNFTEGQVFLYNSFDRPVFGFRYDGNSLPADLSGIDNPSPPPANSPENSIDILTIRYAERTSAVVQSHLDQAAPLRVNTTAGLSPGDIITLSSCNMNSTNAEGQLTPSSYVAQITGIDGNTVNHCAESGCSGVTPGNRLPNIATLRYEKGTEIFRMQMKTYYIGQDDDGNPTLFELDHYSPIVDKQNPRALVEGIENMQIFYGISQQGSDVVRQYVRADSDQIDWNNVVSIKIHLLLQTEDNLTVEPTPYFYVNKTIDPGDDDRRFYRAFTATIGLRNKIEP